jgi:hypothetical protein
MARNAVGQSPESMPPDKPNSVMEFLGKLRSRLATPIKIPAWLVIGFGAYRGIPDLFSETEWWIDAARDASGAIGPAAMLIASPYFGPALVLVGVLWLIFVGEPQKGILRAHWWLYVGWAGVGLLFVGVLMTATFGYALSTFGPRHLHKWQKEALVEHLVLPPNVSQHFMLTYEMGCSDCQGYANEIALVFIQDRNWIFGGIGNGTILMGPTVKPQPAGVVIDYEDSKTQGVPLHIIEGAFTVAKIPFTVRKFVTPFLGNIGIEVRPREDQ